MKKIISGILLLILSVCISDPSFSQDNMRHVDILVRFSDRKAVTPEKHLAESLGYREIHHLRQFNISKWRPDRFREHSLKKTLEILRSDPAVEWAEPNYPRYPHRVPNDPLFPSQWHLLNTGQSGGTPGADIEADSAWNVSTGDGEVVVAVLDTGINYVHPDLLKNMWINPGEDWLQNGVPGNNGIDDDNNGYVDDYYGISVVEEPEQPPFARWPRDPIDINGHGTHVSGIIGAEGNNAVGISGINWNIKLMSLKFMGSQGGDVAGIIECINYILNQKQKGVPVKVVNASYGGSEFSQFEKEAYEALGDHGILIVTSAGNASRNLDSGSPNYPGSYKLNNIINVAATSKNDQLAYFSNYGPNSVHLAAPGSEILSTYLNDSYEIMGGTSTSAPQVTGAVALVYSAFDLTMLEAKERIFRGVDVLESLNGQVFTCGRLSVHKALTAQLKGPYIFTVSPYTGSPGSVVTLTGVRFGSEKKDSKLLFSEVEADIVEWSDNKIECLVPDAVAENDLKVVTSQGSSNSVLFSAQTSYEYFLPFAPAKSPWVSFLILTNHDDQPVHLKVMASESGAYVLDIFPERLMPNQVLYRNIQDYELFDLSNILRVESEKRIQVGILVGYMDVGGLMDFFYIRAQQK